LLSILLFIISIVLILLDIISTEYDIITGVGIEVNPLMKKRRIRIILIPFKILSFVMLYYVSRLSYIYMNFINIGFLVIVIVYSFVVFNNIFIVNLQKIKEYFISKCDHCKKYFFNCHLYFIIGEDGHYCDDCFIEYYENKFKRNYKL